MSNDYFDKLDKCPENWDDFRLEIMNEIFYPLKVEEVTYGSLVIGYTITASDGLNNSGMQITMEFCNHVIRGKKHLTEMATMVKKKLYYSLKEKTIKEFIESIDFNYIDSEGYYIKEDINVPRNYKIKLLHPQTSMEVRRNELFNNS